MALTYDGSLGITFNDGSQMGTASALGMRNRIINGAMVISQRNGTSSVTPANSDYLVDRFYFSCSQSSKFTAQQNAGSVTPPAGFTNYLGLTSSSAYSIGASDYFFLCQPIEGFNTADLGFGTSNAKTVTLSFWVYSSITGTFGGSLRNGSASRSYPFSYTVSSANTWTQASITIAGDTTGTWVGATNGTGLNVFFSLGTGSTFSTTAGSWASGNYVSATGATSVVGTNNATFYITGVQLEKGSVATPFEYRQYGTELALSQRYYWKVTSNGSNITGFGSGQFTSTTNGNVIFTYPVTMRSSPTISYSGSFNVNGGASGFAVSAIGGSYCSPTYGRIDVTVSGATAGYGLAGWINTASTDYVQATAEL
jgi:hypothetical protein